jgi:hypothetical protein
MIGLTPLPILHLQGGCWVIGMTFMAQGTQHTIQQREQHRTGFLFLNGTTSTRLREVQVPETVTFR